MSAVDPYRTGEREIDRAADALVQAQERAAVRRRRQQLAEYQARREAYELRLLEQRERDRPKTLVFLGFGATLALGVLGCFGYLLLQAWQAATSFGAWVAANGMTILGGAVALVVLLAIVGRPAISIVQKVTIR